MWLRGCAPNPCSSTSILRRRNIDLELVPAAITARTRAIMPVHFAGLPVDMDALYGSSRRARIAGRGGCSACHRLALRAVNRSAASATWWCSVSIPNKNMTSIEGGAITTGDAAAAELFEQYRFHGIKRNAAGEVDVMFPGAKSNLTDVAAQIGIDQLRRLDGFNARRRELAGRYFEEFARLRRRGIAGARRLGT